MRAIAIGTVAIALLAAACASPTSVDADAVHEAGSPVSISPVTTSPVVSSPATTSPVTTSPIATSGAAPSDESTAPSGGLDDESEPAEQETTVTTQPPKEAPVAPIESVEPNSSGPVAAAVSDLAQRLSIDESAITVVSAGTVTWPDGSLGCPQPGMGYTQALVSGSLIVLDADGSLYEYHSGGGADPFYCAAPTPPASGEHGDT